jgi:small subunit ribosomal protein S4
MARYAGPRCRKCRQFGFSVCGSARCALERRNNPPGMHPALRRKTSDFKKRLVEKQKLRYTYWITERQFRNYVKKAFQKPGIAGEHLLSILERRLDTMVYRLGFAPSILAARQLVNHGHIRVNGRKVDIPSHIVREHDEIALREKSKTLPLVEEGIARSMARPMPSYVQVNRESLTGTLSALPMRDQIPLDINEALVVEHYTKYL